MGADIHDGPGHNKLQSEAGYIDARPQSRQIDETSCDARPDHTSGSKAPFSRCPQRVRSTSDCGTIAAAQRIDVEGHGHYRRDKPGDDTLLHAADSKRP